MKIKIKYKINMMNVIQVFKLGMNKIAYKVY